MEYGNGPEIELYDLSTLDGYKRPPRTDNLYEPRRSAEDPIAIEKLKLLWCIVRVDYVMRGFT